MNIHWVAYYNDGTTLSQIDGEKQYSYKDIIQGKLSKFALFDGEILRLVVDIPLNWGLIYVHRGLISLGGGQRDVWICGAKQNGTSQQFISVLYDDGRVFSTNRFYPEIIELAPPTNY